MCDCLDDVMMVVVLLLLVCVLISCNGLLFFFSLPNSRNQIFDLSIRRSSSMSTKDKNKRLANNVFLIKTFVLCFACPL